MHQLPKSILFVLFLVISNLSLFAQTSFDSAARVETIQVLNDSIIPPVALLPDTGNLIKEKMRMLLLQKTQEAVRIIRSNNYKKLQHTLYLRIWSGDSTSLLTYLKNVETVLQSGSIANLSGLGSTSFNAIFNKHLSDTAKVFRWMPLNKSEGVLVKKDIFKSFVTDYYNETLPDIRGRYVNKEDIIEASYFLLEQPGNIIPLMNVYRSSLGKFRKSLYDSLLNYHNNLTATSSPYTKSLALLKNDWFKQWFWITGGEIRINPIDFGVDTNTQKHLSDLSKIKIANYSPDDIFLERRLNSLDNFFISSKPNDATIEKWVNKVSIPSDIPYLQFSATGKIKFKNDEIELKRNLYVDSTKTIVIHNIPADRKAGLREDRKVIPNRSAFEEGLDEVISNLGQLAKVYGQVTAAPWSLVLNSIAPQPNYAQSVITSKNMNSHASLDKFDADLNTIFIKVISSDTFSISGFSSDDFLAEFKDLLGKKNLLVDNIFTNIFGTSTVTFGEAATNTYKIKFKKQFDGYISLISQLIQDAATQVLVDSFMVSGLISIYNTASSPLLQQIKTNQDNSFKYYSSTLKTTPIDSTVETIVQPYTVSSKPTPDSIFIAKFKYKIGKTKRFTISAGLAYTLNSYDQSVAKAENGTITITNNNQQYRFVVGLNIYFGKGLYSLNNDLGKFTERWYGFVGVGIPKALENLYFGVGRDLYPGLKLTSGVHIAKHNKYLIQNNQIVEERLRYQAAGPFLSVTIDPTSLINLLNVFKKQ